MSFAIFFQFICSFLRRFIPKAAVRSSSIKSTVYKYSCYSVIIFSNFFLLKLKALGSPNPL
nr:MAG TPA: hypothetical protein [Caudoviricetes sp.]